MKLRPFEVLASLLHNLQTKLRHTLVRSMPSGFRLRQVF